MGIERMRRDRSAQCANDTSPERSSSERCSGDPVAIADETANPPISTPGYATTLPQRR
jgi:hypothetical protein